MIEWAWSTSNWSIGQVQIKPTHNTNFSSRGVIFYHKGKKGGRQNKNNSIFHQGYRESKSYLRNRYKNTTECERGESDLHWDSPDKEIGELTRNADNTYREVTDEVKNIRKHTYRDGEVYRFAITENGGRDSTVLRCQVCIEKSLESK